MQSLKRIKRERLARQNLAVLYNKATLRLRSHSLAGRC